MKIHDLHTEEGRSTGFEVTSSIGRRYATHIASRIPGVTLRKRPKALSWRREEVFCEFEVEGAIFMILEPFGDNSRYWIVPVDSTGVVPIKLVRDTFAHAGRLWSTGKNAA